MSHKTRASLEEGAYTALAFTFAFYLYYGVAGWGLVEYMADGPFKSYVQSPAIHIEILMLGLVGGTLLAAVNRLSDRAALRRRPFGQIVLVRSGLYLGSMLTVCALTILVFRLFIFSPDEFQAMIGLVTPRFLVSMTAWVSESKGSASR